ncbi:MAG: hypothetical protein CME98_00225 [Hyphomonas sp.]|nr:hypothetical protein [Hyphomonas sp.]
MGSSPVRHEPRLSRPSRATGKRGLSGTAPPRRPKPEAEDGEGGALLFRDAKPGHYARRRKRVSP